MLILFENVTQRFFENVTSIIYNTSHRKRCFFDKKQRVGFKLIKAKN